MRFVHRLVLEAFVGPCPDGMECRHFPDRNPANNAISNLSWATKKVNSGDRFIHKTAILGDRNHSSKLTESAVRSIREDHANGVTSKSLAKKHSVSRAAINYVISGKTWKHVGKHADHNEKPEGR